MVHRKKNTAADRRLDYQKQAAPQVAAVRQRDRIIEFP
jgi:hypothetical protein